MATGSDDDDLMSPGLAGDLLGQPPPGILGLGTTLNGMPSMNMSRIPAKIAGYVDSRDPAKFIPLVQGTSPGAFAAQQQSPAENFVAGYGAETANFGREIGDLANRIGSIATGNPAASLVPAAKDPNADIQGALFDNSRAANWGRTGADFVNTLPAAGVGGELVAPAAGIIKGAGLLPSIGRAAVIGVGRGIAAGTAVPADDTDSRLHHILTWGALGTVQGLWPVAKALAGY
jgi:hypothetical protein